jgi:hypothetical protein
LQPPTGSLSHFTSLQKPDKEDIKEKYDYNYRILQLLAKNLWPDAGSVEHSRELKTRVVTSFGLMVASKLVTIQVPFLFKGIIDFHDTSSNKLGDGVVSAVIDAAVVDPSGVGVPVTMVLGYGIARTTASAFGELRSTLFSTVAQRAIRQVC